MPYETAQLVMFVVPQNGMRRAPTVRQLVVASLILAMLGGCGRSHDQYSAGEYDDRPSSGADFSARQFDAGTDDPSTDLDPPGEVEDLAGPCRTAETPEGRLNAQFSAPDLGDVSMRFELFCLREEGSLGLRATDGISSLAIDAPASLSDEGDTFDFKSSAVLSFQGLATFKGTCNACIQDARSEGSAACTLVWDEESGPVKASLTAYFHCQ